MKTILIKLSNITYQMGDGHSQKKNTREYDIDSVTQIFDIFTVISQNNEDKTLMWTNFTKGKGIS